MSDGPTREGFWWATGPEGRTLLVVDKDASTGELMIRLADAIHGKNPWFSPDTRYWKDWQEATMEERAARKTGKPRTHHGKTVI